MFGATLSVLQRQILYVHLETECNMAYSFTQEMDWCWIKLLIGTATCQGLFGSQLQLVPGIFTVKCPKHTPNIDITTQIDVDRRN